MRGLPGIACVCALLVGCSGDSGRTANIAVSRAPGPQNEPAIALDPSDPTILLAGSNSWSERTTRVYSSTDGGKSWSSSPGPPLARGIPGRAVDPLVGIDRSGRQYFAFMQFAPGAPSGTGGQLVLATRADPRGAWRTRVVPGGAHADKPALAVAGRAVYLAWIAFLPDGLRVVRLSSSNDGGSSWSRPVRVNDRPDIVFYPSVSVGRGGVVYVAWNEVGGIALDSSDSRGRRFGRDRHLADVPLASRCGFHIPAQPTTCVWPNPVVTTDRVRGRIFVTYSAMGANAALDVFVVRLSGQPRQVNPPDEGPSDQFWPASAVDQSTGRLWVCFYDTRDDPGRVRAVFSCTASADAGRTWTKPLAAASVPSDETQRGAAKGPGGREYGDYEALAVEQGIAHPMWTDSRDLKKLREEIYTTTLTDADVREPG